MPPLAWSRPVWWLFVKEVKAKRFRFLFLFSRASKSLPLIFTRSRSFVFIDPKNTRLACLYIGRQLTIIFLQITTSLLDFQNSLWLKKRSCVSKVLISLMVKRRWNGLLDISEQSNLERIYYEQKHVYQYLNLKWLLHIMRRPPPSLTPLCTIFSPFPRPTPWKRARNSCKGGATFEFWFLSTLAPFFVFLCEFFLGHPSSFNYLIDGVSRAINICKKNDFFKIR